MRRNKIIAIGAFATACAAAAVAVIRHKAYQRGFDDAREEYLEDIEDMCNGMDNCEIEIAQLEEEIEVLREQNKDMSFKVTAMKAENDVYRRVCPPDTLNNELFRPYKERVEGMEALKRQQEAESGESV